MRNGDVQETPSPMLLRDEAPDRGSPVASGILLCAAALMAIGLVAVASASAGVDEPLLRKDILNTALGRQGAFVAAGLLVMLAAAHIGPGCLRWRPGRLNQGSIWLLIGTVALLAAVFAPGIGVERHGARRWLSLGPAGLGLSFQPSELAKVTLIVFLAAWLSGGTRRVRRFWFGLLPATLVIGALVALVGREDFGTAALLAGVAGLMLLIAGARWYHLLVFAIPGVVGFAYMLTMKEYRVKRLTAFLDIWSDPRGDGYHAVQSLVGIAGGSWFGRGLGGGIQKYGYLPESRTDFIFSVWAEETGLFGCLVVLMLFATLLVLGTKAALNARSGFERLLAAGITLLITIQAAMNVAVVTVSVPTKGIALPLVSAGGSGVLVYCAALGLLAGVAMRARPASASETETTGDGLLSACAG